MSAAPCLPSGLSLRSALSHDAQAFVALFEALAGETDFLLFGPGERGMSLARQAELFSAPAAQQVTFLARDGELPVGFATASSGRGRAARTASVVMGVSRTHHRRGIGRVLLANVEQWARAQALRRLELSVRADNAAAIALYRAAGFEHEGTRRDCLFGSGAFHSELVMGRVYSKEVT